jgi:uncharacterized membrane protein
MAVFIIGLILFLGVHSLRVFADGWRGTMVARLGLGPWKGLYALASLAGFAVLVWGYGMARQAPVIVWSPPAGMRHATELFTLIAFIFFAASRAPGNVFKARVGHPMLIGVKFWAFGHLLANGTLNDIVLFGAFLAWAVVTCIAARRRDRRAGVVYPAATAQGSGAALVVGVIAWVVFAAFLHRPLIGVSPFG